MQYWRFLLMPGLKPVSRYQLADRDPDVPRLTGLDRPVCCSARLAVVLASRSDRPALRMAALCRCSGHVVRRQDREHPRRAGAAGRAARLWRQRTLSGQRRNRNAVLHPAVPIQWCSHTIPLAKLALGRTIGWSAAGRGTSTQCRCATRPRSFWPHDADRLGRDRRAGVGEPCRPSDCAADCRRPRTGGADGGRYRRARHRPPARGSRHRPPSGRNRPARDPAPPWCRPRNPIPCLTACAARAACCGRCASTTAMRRRRAAMDRLYAAFVRPGDLVFDIGAHVGDRVAAFRRRGARVVAVEPQPALVAALRLIYGRDPAVAVEAGRRWPPWRDDPATPQPRQSDSFDRIERFRAGRGRRARLGERALDDIGDRADDHARCADRASWQAGVHQDRR